MKGKFLTLIGTAMSLALTTHVAVAESNKSPMEESRASSTSLPTEIKMSLEGMKILCEHFPLNSRCAGGAANIFNNPSNNKIPEASPDVEKTNPGSTTVPTESPSPQSGNPNQPNPAPASPTESR
jgi:hypothetical protein